jgi:hypothetical protein
MFKVLLTITVLHKKRPDLIPVLDNQAIFGAYMNPHWPQQLSSQYSVKSLSLVEQALDWITFDLLRVENTAAWSQLQVIEPSRSLIEIFDCVWWGYFRKLEPVKYHLAAQPALQPTPTTQRVLR